MVSDPLMISGFGLTVSEGLFCATVETTVWGLGSGLRAKGCTLNPKLLMYSLRVFAGSGQQNIQARALLP